ncbi:MAG: response regulator transcription factor [Candidatus Eisenbacteria bacterium]
MSPAVKLSVLLVEDHALVRAGLRQVLERSAAVGKITEADTVRAALEILGQARVDLVLLDLNLPDADGFEVLRYVESAGLPTRVLILSMHAEPVWVRRAVREGAAGYLVKDLAVHELHGAIDAIARGGVFFSSSAQAALASATRGTGGDDPLDRLTPREREVLVDVARGLPTKAIATSRNISPRTVETHRSSLMQKLQLHSVAELTRFALERGLLGPGRDTP